MVMPEQTHIDGRSGSAPRTSTRSTWRPANGRNRLQEDAPPGAKDHGSYGVAADSKNNFYGLELNADYIIKVDSKNLIPTYYRTPTPIPARGAVTSTTRTGSGSRRIAPQHRDVRRQGGALPGVEAADALCDALMTRSSDTAAMAGRAEWATITSRVLT